MGIWKKSSQVPLKMTVSPFALKLSKNIDLLIVKIYVSVVETELICIIYPSLA